MTENLYPVGTTVFAKLKGYPWWPARIENEQDLPVNVSSKKPKQRPIWPVFFLCGWFGTTELKPFDPASAEKTKSTLKRGSALRTALGEALDPSIIAHRITGDAEEDDDDDDDQTKRTTQKGQTNVEKKRRPSTSEDQTAKRKVSKKTASVEDDNNELAKPSIKRTASAPRSRLESDFKSVDDDISIGDTSNGRTKQSEDDAGDAGDLRAKKRIKSGQPSERLLKLRHKLQKLLLVEGLSDDVLIQNLERADPILAEVEAFDIDLQMLKDTKIGRLMKKISALQFSQDPHKIVERSAQEHGEILNTSVDKGTESSTPVTETAPVVADKNSNAAEAEHEMATAPLANSNNNISDPSAPAPEAVMAAMAAIVGTSTVDPPASSIEPVAAQDDQASTGNNVV
ncbi:hypothetical protein BCR41DRAFT_356837 [Lobosporangium transversale]|uniref:PWWP domain-containing protein n=1 Tax=Lobosporangium transversale TaxID=64571 RepID=A0A1Y2GHG2_9FUNG|nr:hypothetical protein BCR41DRAFT_357265 [Lobosporangium transversale]XP_021879826.1 hypothetical protein BCR41DRAFT_356837 [Lobosporangium transversale]ORZ10965.1 hypothetical protein BCR41DRAFT_357265 [Lobosporangium transversale]ORZ11729.1 hypothetical protein BCR41DRAFT_356837 [Lobosporangium transversale]|eukprot:XP_021879482.1 hypothetical protein BCR41DRAFT_357265 [Lobosporangium transversale]